jgi:asparagine synthase (glutamine-hydrolysing)
MCGIAGFLDRDPEPLEKREHLVAQMIGAIRHRGPDGQGYWCQASSPFTAGHCRLAIIDLSADGRQPMVSHDGRYIITFNGEIYNYLELRDELRCAGVKFRGHSDTEVLVEAIAQWGLPHTLPRLWGMFAFAVWDTREQNLTLARDRAGKKPLYYLKTPERLLFASEIKAFKAIADLHLSLDKTSVYHYLSFGYVPAPRTIYRQVTEVGAGHFLVVNRDLEATSQPYWELRPEKKQTISFAQAVSEAETLLAQAVKLRLRADVPVGCFLSGGIDSGLLTALAATQVDHPLETFTVSFAEGTFDESPLAALVAARYGTRHHVLALSPDVQNLLPRVVAAYDEPLADASIIPSYCIAHEAHKFLKVIINGEGGDELFGGYRRQMAMHWYSWLQPCLDFIPESGWHFLQNSLPQPRSFRSRYAFGHRFLRGMVRDPFERYLAWCVDGFTESEKSQLCGDWSMTEVPATQILRDRFGDLLHLHPLDHFMAMDFLFNMHDDMLVKMDIATMAHGLEGRNPFLDQQLVEWASRLPPAVRLGGVTTKPLLRELAKKYLPPEVAAAPKRGFEVPLIDWLRHDLFAMVHDTCLAPGGLVTNLFKRAYVENLLFERLDLDPDRWSKRVFNLFILGLWEKAVQ